MYMKRSFKWMLLTVFWLIGLGVWSQITISMANLQTVNVSPSELCRITVFNQGDRQMVAMEAEIINSMNEVVVSVNTLPFYLDNGMMNINPEELSFGRIHYNQSEQGQYLQGTKKLPSGLYKYCVKVTGVKDNAVGDSYCQEISSLDNAFLFLVNPEDKEGIETKNPVLLWMHSEPFDVLTPNEEFKLVLVLLDKEQSAQSGISINPPIFYVNKVSVHNVQYPLDAPELISGERYGWQIQRVSNGIIIDRTEAWEFIIRSEEKVGDLAFVCLRKNMDSGYYPVVNDKIFFSFQEKYSSKNISCAVYGSTKAEEIVNPENVTYEHKINYKVHGYNEFEIDLEPLNLKSGFYVLEVHNEKEEKFKLKFFIAN